jgi:hypothetical protein
MTGIPLAMMIICVAIFFGAFAIFMDRLMFNCFFHHWFGSKEEKELLHDLEEDIRANIDDWITVDMSTSTEFLNSLYNDRKHICVNYNRDCDKVLVEVGKNFLINRNLTAEGVYSVIKGRQVSRFLKKVEKLLDTRGRELRVFKEVLKENLKG